MAKHDWFDYLTTAGIAGGALFTGAMALYTRTLGKQTRDSVTAATATAAAAEKEAKAVEEQGKSLAAQAEATAAQAKATAEQAEAARQQVSLTRDSIRSSSLPWLTLGEAENVRVVFGSGWNGTVYPFLVRLNGHNLQASITLKNVGNGLAIVHPQDCKLSGWVNPKSANPDLRMAFDTGVVLNPVLPVGEQTRVEFDMDLTRWQTSFDDVTHARLGGPRELYFEIIYTDVSGEVKTLANFHAYQPDAQSAIWDLIDIAYYSPLDTTEPVVVRKR